MEESGEAGLLSGSLTSALVQSQGLNEFLDASLQAIGEAFRVERLAVYDYHEETSQFDLLYFRGYPPESRSLLRRRMKELDLRRALGEREPYWAAPGRLAIPLYFQEILEAVLVVEAAGAELDPAQRAACRLISRFLGLFLSSSRLAINQRSGSLPAGDLERARLIQLTYLPQKPLVGERFEAYGANTSSAIVGGDYFDFFQSAPDSLQCILADASGHGLSAALIMSTFRGLLHSGLSEVPDCGALFSRLNRHVYTGADFVQFLTAVFLDYRPASRELRYSNAGHFDPLLVHADGSVSQLPGGGPPLGILKEFPYGAGSTTVRPGDLAVLYTDGLAELEDAGQNAFGREGVLEAVVPVRARPLEEVAGAVLERARKHRGGERAEDDVTLLLVRFA